MYASLNTIDVQLGPQDGRVRVIQADHRELSAIVAEPNLSTLFALIRCVNPLRSSEPLSVIYNYLVEPPGFLRDAVVAAGADLWVGDDPSFLMHPRTPPTLNVAIVNALFAKAMRELALAAGSHPAAPLEAVIQAERAFKTSGVPGPDDESAFWSAVVKLAAVTGEVLRISADGAWLYKPEVLGTLPFACDCRFKGARATVNPLGKALKFIRNPFDGEEPSAMIKSVLASP